MFDFKFNWDSSIDTGIDIIDEQHKELFRIGRDVEQLVITGCVGVTTEHLLSIVCELRNYAGYHFYMEECLMRQYEFEDMEAHCKKHQEYMDYIMNFDCKKLGEDTLNQMIMLKDQIVSMVFDHMVTEDHKFAKTIKSEITKDK